MELKANVNFDRFEAALQVVDAHTVGEFCRMVIGGFPEPEGNTMIEKKKWLEDNYDRYELIWLFCICLDDDTVLKNLRHFTVNT